MAVAMCLGFAACVNDEKDKTEGGIINGGSENDNDKDEDENQQTEVVAKNITLSETAVTLALDEEKALTYTVSPEGRKLR